MSRAYGPDKLPVVGTVGPNGFTEDGNYEDLHLSRQGALITQDQLLEWALEGRMFHAQQGDAATKLDFGETAYDEDQPQFALRVPTGRTIIPVSLVTILEDMAGADNHIIWSTTTNDIGDGTSTAAAVSALRTDAPYASGCTARSLYTANATAATGLIEVIRFFAPFADASTAPLLRFEWNVRSAGLLPVLVGPATLQLHVFGGTAPQGYGEYAWVEFETPYLVKS